MIELLLFVAALALIDGLASPATLGGVLYLLSRPHPLRSGLAFTAASLAVYVVVGLLLEGGLRLVAGWSVIDARLAQALAEIVVGGLLVLAGDRSRRRPASEVRPAERRWGRSFGAALLGLTVTTADLTTAAPYLAAIERINSAGLTAAGTVLAILWYDAVYILPMLLLFGTPAALRRRSAGRLPAASSVRRRVGRWLGWLMILVGAGLVLDGAVSFLR